jgi:hypothetical protein
MYKTTEDAFLKSVKIKEGIFWGFARSKRAGRKYYGLFK